MKRSLLMGILCLASTTSLLAQSGHILISNYLVPPYNQVVYHNTAVNDPSAHIQIWYGYGVVTDEGALMPGVSFGINPAIFYDPGEGFGPGGYFDAQNQVIPGWTSGPVTFQLRLGFSPPFDYQIARTTLWVEESAIVSTSLPANVATTVPTWIPEPSTLALAGVGLAAASLYRRRNHVNSGSD